MIKAVIIDDESGMRKNIRNRIISSFQNDIIIVGEADSVEEGVKLISVLQPNLLLLDVELKDGNSFEILSKLKAINFQTIFITGFNEHAIKAIKVGALDYILKPIDNNEFENSISRAINSINNNNTVISDQLNVSSDYFQGHKNKRIVLKTAGTHYIVYEHDIVYCNSDGNYTTFFMSDATKILISKSMKKVEELVSKNLFIKCHQSYLVNNNYIEKYLADGYLVLKHDVIIPIAARRKEYVINRINAL